MFQFLANLLAFFYGIWPSFGGAIVLFTLAIMLVLTPLSIKSTRSMIAMQRLQPEMKRLQQKYKNDRETLNKEMMAFYQANNINPFSSCLPLLLQMPVFIVLYRVLRGLVHIKGGQTTFSPSYLDHKSDLYRALVGKKEMVSFGMDLSKGALNVLRDSGVVAAIPFMILVALVVVTALVQQRQIQGRNPNAAAANPQQQMIGKIMPFIFVPISISIPAGVVIYFVVSNAVRIGQQALVGQLESRSPTGGGAIDVKDKETSSEPKAAPPAREKAPKELPKKDTGPANRNGGGARPRPQQGGGSSNGSRSPGSASRPRNRRRKRK